MTKNTKTIMIRIFFLILIAVLVGFLNYYSGYQISFNDSEDVRKYLSILIGVFALFISIGITLLITIREEGRERHHLIEKNKFENTTHQSTINLQSKSNKKHIEIIEGINKSDRVSKIIATGVYASYLDQIEINSKSIKISGEYWALEASCKYWQHLFKLQEQRKRNNEDCLIVRVTHSNSIDYWKENLNNHATMLYSHQGKFLEAGGIILRIFIGDSENPNADYERIMERLKSLNKRIQVRYLKKDSNTEISSDILILHTEKIGLKWNSKQWGEKLDNCEIIKELDSKMISEWRSLYNRLKDKNEEFTIIPEGRHIYDEE